MSRTLIGLIFLLSFVLIYSCKKDPITIDVRGTVYDNFLGESVAGALVQFYVQDVENGIISFQYKFIGSTSTNDAGNFEFNFEYRNATIYKMRVIKEKYIISEREIPPANWPPDEVNIENFEIVPEAYFKVHLKNQNPFSEYDNLLFQMNYDTVQCATCCHDFTLYITGFIDTTIYCTVAGETKVNLYYIANTQMSGTYDLDFFCPAFDTTAVDVFY